MVRLPASVKLKDGRTATIDFLKRSDNVCELQRYINSFVAEDAMLCRGRKATLKEEEEFKKSQLSAKRKNIGFLLVAKVDGKIAGSTGADREKVDKGRDNVSLGLAIAKEYRGIGLGKALLGLNIKTAKKLLKPKNIFLSVLGPNKPAKALYMKLGFREFAVFPRWILHDGKYVDQIYMKLER